MPFPHTVHLKQQESINEHELKNKGEGVAILLIIEFLQDEEEEDEKQQPNQTKPENSFKSKQFNPNRQSWGEEEGEDSQYGGI